MRNIGLLSVSSAEQLRRQVCWEAVGFVQNYENLKLLLWFPQEEVLPNLI